MVRSRDRRLEVGANPVPGSFTKHLRKNHSAGLAQWHMLLAVPTVPWGHRVASFARYSPAAWAVLLRTTEVLSMSHTTVLRIGICGWFVLTGCGGSAVAINDTNSGGMGAATGGTTNVALGGGGQSTLNTSVGDSTGGTTNLTTGSSCTGSLETVRAIWLRCPDSYCQAIAMISSCSAAWAMSRTVRSCGIREVTMDLLAHGMSCYYAAPVGNGTDTALVGALAWDDGPSFCSRTSYVITSGNTTCGGVTSTWDFGACTGPTGTGGAAGIAIPLGTGGAPGIGC